MKIIRVVAAVIKAENKQGQPIIFATQRGYENLKEAGNSPVEKLSREKRRKRHSNEKYRKNLIPKSRWEVLLIH